LFNPLHRKTGLAVTTVLIGRVVRSACLVLCCGVVCVVSSARGSAQAQVSPTPQTLPSESAEKPVPPTTPAAAASPQAPVTPALEVLPALQDTIWKSRGVMVSAIRFEGVELQPGDPLLSELQQQAHTPLSPEAVQADLRRLYGSGKYRDLAVRGEQSGGSFVLIYAGVPRYYVGRVTVHGVQSERLSSLLEFATRLDPGTAYTDAELPAAVLGLSQTLSSNGFYQPVINVVTVQDDQHQQIDFNFTVAVGPQARVGALTVEGNDIGYTLTEFRKKAGLNCGRLARLFNKSCLPKVTRETTSNALSDLRSAYQKRDRLEATVSVQKQTYVPVRQQLDYDMKAQQGPVVRVIVDGAKISKSRLHLLVPVFEEGAVDNDLLNEGTFNIRDYLQQKGYFDVTVRVDLEGAKSANVTVHYFVNEGSRHKVRSVRIKGNKYFDANTIQERLGVKKADSYQRSGTYSGVLVKSDVASIEALYRANGFDNASVTSSVKNTDNGPNGRPLKVATIDVTFTIVEGPQKKFGTVKLSGVSPTREQAVDTLLQTEHGQPFSLLTLSGDRDAILNYYLAHGFEQARVEIKQQIEPGESHVADVQFNVAEGAQVFVDKVLLSGIRHTRRSLVEEQLLIHANEPLNESALLETQRNLYNLALFNEANVAVQNPTGDAPRKNVLVQLTEAKRWDVTYGFGFEAQTGTPGTVPGQTRGTTAAQNGKAGVSPRVTLDVSRINLRGTQQSLTLHATYGLLERVATLTYNYPDFFNRKNLSAAVSGGYSNVQNISTFSSSVQQVDFRVVQKYKRADTFIYDYQFRRVSVDPNSLEITPNLIPQLSEPVTIGGPQLTYFHDTRDPTPLNAGRGQFFSFQEFFAWKKLGSGTTFNRTDVSQSTYYTFGKKKYVFARNTRVGFENFFGANPNQVSTTAIGQSTSACAGALLDTNATCNPVPLPERLYAGGATSHRGFGINSAGPRDLTTGYPVGGSGVVVNTFELRFPPPTLPLVGDSLSFVIFHDMGNVFRSPKDMFSSIRNFQQPDQALCRNLATPLAAANGVAANAVGNCNFNYYSHAVGLGLRYATPVGPIRVDFSYNLNPPIYPVFDDYTGAAPYVGQANHFNFFFSIGQAF
jgi:outer membrane protein insertion porin family